MTRRSLRVGSTFTGVGGADLGLQRAGFDIAWTCEKDDWKRSVLQAHWPDVTHHADICDLRDPPSVDLLCGGFPCQDLSVAGKRAGFAGDRSVLAFEYLRLAESLQPRWLLLENVPGLLSSNRGRDLARLLDEVGAIGYGWAYRIVDARYFGVPQRRRRVFICARRADTADDFGDAARLALRALWESGSGDSTQGWPPWPETTADAGGGAQEGGGNPIAFYYSGGGNDSPTSDGVSPTVKKGSNIDIGSPPAITFRKSKRAQSDQDDETRVEAHETNTLNAFDTGDTRATQIVTAFPQNQREEVRDLGQQTGALTGPGTHQQTFIASVANAFDTGDTRATQLIADVASTLQRAGGDRGQRIDAEGAAGGHLIPVSPTLTKHNFDSRSPQSEEQQRIINAVHDATMSVRRLTPIECERLMGWPDNWTAPEGIKAPDSKRYAACGDGIVSWVAYWIGQRIQMLEEQA